MNKCPYCEKEFNDKFDMEFIEDLGICSTCDKLNNDRVENLLDEVDDENEFLERL